MELVWDFCRELDGAATPGNTTSYFDEMCQSFYVDSGTIKTQIATLDDGQWQDITRDAEIVISDSGYADLDIEHHYNGVVFGSAQHDADVVLLVYTYMLDVSAWLQAGQWQLQPDNPIKAGSITVKNADKTLFQDDSFTLFAPGSRVSLKYHSGDSDAYQLGLFHIEDSPYSDDGDMFTFRGRNPIGFHLASQSFDDRTSYTGERSAVIAQMLSDAGVPDNLVSIQADATAVAYTFNDSDSYLTGLQTVLNLADWYLDDLPDGNIIIGNLAFIQAYFATGIYTFNRGSDVISRSVSRSTSGVYSRVCVKRGGATPLSIYAEIPYYDGWYLSTHRTFYQNVPDTITQTDMEKICDDLVAGMQYSGITEQFGGMFRPWLQTGDVAVVTGGITSRLAGIMTDIIHTFGENGFFTSFTITSGGTISNPDNPATVASKFAGKMGGVNRQRRLLDYIANQKGISSGGSSAVAYQAAAAGGYTGDIPTFNTNLGAIASGAIIPVGGTSGQVLKKATGDDYDTEWDDESGGSPLTTKGDLLVHSTVDTRLPVGTDGQALIADSAQTAGVKWGDAPAAENGLPIGGTTGQVLKKTSGTDYAAGWYDESGGAAIESVWGGL